MTCRQLGSRVRLGSAAPTFPSVRSCEGHLVPPSCKRYTAVGKLQSLPERRGLRVAIWQLQGVLARGQGLV
eukprot:scaffold17929_cov130-Isochrysis_galbana.AAC.4